jgi:transmembrane sensor
MTPTDEQIRVAIAQQAADWFLDNRSGSLDDKGRAAFMSWLRISPVNVEEYLCIAAIERDLRFAAADPPVSLESLIAQARPDQANGVASFGPSTLRWRSLWKRGWAPVLGVPAAALAILLVGFMVHWPGGRELFGLNESYETAHREHRSLRLADGSSVLLNTESAVRIRFTRTERVVEVVRGQAFFKVAHDARRRFRVAVGGADVLALSTQFDVYARGKTTLVTVVEGQIAVFSGHAPPPLLGAVPVVGGLTVRAIQQVRIESGVVSGQPVAVDVHRVEAWLHDQIVFDQRPLGEVAEEFNRNASIPLEISDPSLRALLVSGVFNIYDMDSFVAFLQTLDGVTVDRTSTRIYAVRRSPAGRDRPPKP